MYFLLDCGRIYNKQDFFMDKTKISKQEEQLIESISEPASYEIDGEKITQQDPEKILKVLQEIRKPKLKNSIKALGLFKISTQGPQP